MVNDRSTSIAPLGRRKIKVGKVDSSFDFSLPAEALDGRITVITGRKDSGKSHLAKMLLRGLLEDGAYSLVFDLNDEYGATGLSEDGTKSSVASKIVVLRPGRELKFGLSSVGMRAVRWEERR